jgi:hypothetical protein
MTQKINRSPPRAKSLSIRKQLEQRIRDALSQQPGAEEYFFAWSRSEFEIKITTKERGMVELVLLPMEPESERDTDTSQRLLNEEWEAREYAFAQVLKAFRNSKKIVVTDQETFVGKISDFMSALEESFLSKKPSLGR